MSSKPIAKDTAPNIFLEGSLPKLFVKTAAPIILIMTANGFFTLVDAYYLGRYVGVEALTAVTLMFPLYMLLVAVSTLVSSGYSSVFARLLGANSTHQAGEALYAAITLSLLVSLILIVVFLALSDSLILQLTNGTNLLAAHGYTYISILIFFCPIVFILGVSVDTLRCEGKISEMLAVTIFATSLNFVFNYLLIVKLNLGVAGSAYGTVAAQSCALCVAIYLRQRSKSIVKIRAPKFAQACKHWLDFVSLGIPQSVSHIGLSLTAVVVLFSIQTWNGQTYEVTAGAYGIITRLMTFTILPLLGLSIAFQTIIGNNYGATKYRRCLDALKIALVIAVFYCMIAQSCFYIFRNSLGLLFVDDQEVATEISRILPINTLLFFISGPMLIVTIYFQAIGKAIKSAILSLPRTYLFTIPLILVLPNALGEVGIWYAAPIAELLMIGVTVAVFLSTKKSSGSFFYTKTKPFTLN